MRDAAVAAVPDPVPAASSTSEPAHVSLPASVSSRIASPAQASAAATSSPIATTPTIPSLPPKPDVEADHRSGRPRRTRSPPSGPRNHIPTPPNATPPHTTQPIPSLPPKPDWPRRNTAAQSSKTGQSSKAEGPTSAPAATNPAEPELVIPVYVPKQYTTSESEAELSRILAHRKAADAEYLQIVLAKRRAMHEYEMSTIDLKMAERRRELADAQLEKARLGILGIDFIS
ncbi:hypothetical protein C8Q79DRAFT_1009089 [Trametes meyenii]|nr:hypothetical protein C8Q79DRAFT_1009089 [Trametes meyenii]